MYTVCPMVTCTCKSKGLGERLEDEDEKLLKNWDNCEISCCTVFWIYLLDIGDSAAAKHIVMAFSQCRMNHLLHHQPKDQVLLVFQVSCEIFFSYVSLNRASDISRGRGPAKFRYFREIPRNCPKTRNTAKSARNISKYMSAKHI